MGLLLRMAKIGAKGYKKGVKGYRKGRHHLVVRPRGEWKAVKQEFSTARSTATKGYKGNKRKYSNSKTYQRKRRVWVKTKSGKLVRVS